MREQRNRNLPRRVFLDTNVLWYLCSFGSFIYDNFMTEDEEVKFCQLSPRIQKDLQALADIVQVARRGLFEFAVSPRTVEELSLAKIPLGSLVNRAQLVGWGLEWLDYWSIIMEELPPEQLPPGPPPIEQAQYVVSKVDFLPDISDRWLVVDALAYRCDAFLTCDRHSIWRHRNKLERLLNIRVLTPSVYWELLRR